MWDQTGGLRSKGSSALLGSTPFGLSRDGTRLFGTSVREGGNEVEFFRADVNGDAVVRSGSVSTGNFLSMTNLSNDERVAIGTTRIDNETRVVRWAEGGSLTSLGTIGGGRTQFAGMNTTGTDIVGTGTASNSYNYAFRWTEGGGMHKLAPSDITQSSAGYVSADAQTVVGTFEGRFGNRLFRSTPSGGFVDLGHLGSYNTYLLGIYDGGDRVYGMSGTTLYDNSHIVRWTTGQGLVDISVPGASTTTLGAISADGSVTILTGTKNAVNAVYRRTEDGTYTDLGKILGKLPSIGIVSTRGDRMIASVSPDGTNNRLFNWTQANGFQDMGLIAGATSATITLSVDDAQFLAGVSRVGTTDRAWLWDGTYGMMDLQTLLTGKGLDLSGWDSLNKVELLEVREGVAYLTGLGTYQGTSGIKFHAVVPEPSSLVALGGLSILLARRRRKTVR